MDKFQFKLRTEEIARAKTKKAKRDILRVLYEMDGNNKYYYHLEPENLMAGCYTYRLFCQMAIKFTPNEWLQRESQRMYSLRSSLSAYFTSEGDHTGIAIDPKFLTYSNFVDTFEFDTKFTASGLTAGRFKKFTTLIVDNVPKQIIDVSIRPSDAARSTATNYELAIMIEVETVKRTLAKNVTWTVVEAFRDKYLNTKHIAVDTAKMQATIDEMQASLTTIKEASNG